MYLKINNLRRLYASRSFLARFMACLKSGQLCLEIGVLSSSFTEVLSETVSTTKRHSESCRVSLFVLLVVARVGQSVRSGVRAVLRSCGDSSLTVAEFVSKLSGYLLSCTPVFEPFFLAVVRCRLVSGFRAVFPLVALSRLFPPVSANFLFSSVFPHGLLQNRAIR